MGRSSDRDEEFKTKDLVKITCVNVIVLSITQNYPSALWFSKHYWVLSYLEIIGWTQSLQFRNEPTFWRQNNCSRIHCNSWDVVTHQHSGAPAIHTFDVNADAQYVVTHQHSGDLAINVVSESLKAGLVVTHQHSGDPAIYRETVLKANAEVVTHQHSGDPAI